MGLKHTLTLLAALAALSLRAAEIRVEGLTNAIPPLTQDVRALHLRAVGADRVYALHPPAGLRELNLSANALPALPADLVPKSVVRLWLADNRLTHLPAAIGAMPALEYLNLDRNLLVSLPDLSRTRLRWLRLNGNRLVTLPSLPPTVERLYLAGNRLAAAPAKPAALRHLILADNPIASVPDDLGAGLEWLDLSGTRLTALPADLSAWRTLKILDLSGCPLPETEKDRIEAAFDPDRTTLLF